MVCAVIYLMAYMALHCLLSVSICLLDMTVTVKPL